MKKTYIEPYMEVMTLNYGVVLAGSFLGKDFMGEDTKEDEVIEGD